MLTETPSREELKSRLGTRAFAAWMKICDFIDQNYETELLWGSGGKYGKYVLRFKNGAKTLCTLYVRENQFGCWVILGQVERDRFEESRAAFSYEIRNIYDTTPVFHDGKWVMLEISDDHLSNDIIKMILIKKKPNKMTTE